MSTWRVRRLAPLRASQIPVLLSCQSVHNHSRRAIAQLAPLDSHCDTSQAPPTSAINSDSPELKQTMFCFLEDACTGYHVFSTEPLTQTAIPEQLRRSLTSPAQSASVITTTEPCGIKIATNDHVACRISNRISEQTLDVDFITSGCCADVSGQLTNCVLDVRTIQPE